MGGQTLNVGNMAKRGILNQGIKALIGGSKMGMAVPLIAGGLGLAYLRNPLREGSMNYNPYLKDQISFLNENNMINRNDPSGLLKYGSPFTTTPSPPTPNTFSVAFSSASSCVSAHPI